MTTTISDAAQFGEISGVSRETLAALETYVGLLADWNGRHNLVSAASLDQVWHRHVWDSAQLSAYVPASTTTLVDMGSGAGFPGLVLAILFRQTVKVTLYEATAKKCQFLQTVSDRLALGVDVQNQRMEDSGHLPFDILTARACAPLDRLLGYAQHFVGPHTICLFLKGQSVETELTEASKSWNMRVQQHPSLTDPSGTVLEIRELAHVAIRPAPPAHPGRRQSKRRRR